MIELIPLERIDDNPYQTRTVYNEAAIEELAADIKQLEPARPETLGLIQVPLGRIVYYEPGGGVTVLADPLTKLATDGALEKLLKESENFRIQLAAGHSRLRAFRHLAEADGHWSVMPVDLAHLQDSEMADIAWSENAKRRSISAIEEAEAIERAKTELGYTSADIQHRWGLTGSTISNKTRLLQLPVKVQEMIKAGDLRERHARELLPLVQVLGDHQGAIKMAKNAVKLNFSANEMGREVSGAIERKTTIIPGDVAKFNRWNGHQLPPACQYTCIACEHYTRGRCLKPDVALIKKDTYNQATMEIAAEAAGVKTSPKTWWQHTRDTYEHAIAKECSNLAVTYVSWTNQEIVPASDEFKNLYFGCVEGYGCECAKNQKAATTAEQDDPWAALNKWREEQQEQAKSILDDTLDHLTGSFKEALAIVDEKRLAYFVALIKRTDNNLNVKCNLESVAHYLAVATNGRWGLPNTAGKALLHRAEIYGLCQINTPVDEAQARLTIIEELLTGRELSPRKRDNDWMFTDQIDKCAEILANEPGTTALRKKLADLRQRFEESK